MLRSSAPEQTQLTQSSLNRLSSQMVIQLKVNGPRGEEKIVDLCDAEEKLKKMTVQDLKGIITDKFDIKGDIRVVYKTQMMEDSSLLMSYGVRHMSNIQTLLMLPGGS